MSTFFDRIQRKLSYPWRTIRYARSQKIFCIGKNKTGTTSMARLFSEMGLEVANQRKAEILTDDWLQGDYSRIIRYVRYAGEAFQDIPFSLPDTYKVLNQAFPNSKFILTERKDAETWCDSLINFHSKVFGHGNIPTKQDLQQSDYIYKGFAWKMMNALHDIKDDDVYNRNMLIKDYKRYNKSVKDYFGDYSDKLLVVTLEDPKITEHIKEFLGIDSTLAMMPWENKTQA